LANPSVRPFINTHKAAVIIKYTEDRSRKCTKHKNNKLVEMAQLFYEQF